MRVEFDFGNGTGSVAVEFADARFADAFCEVFPATAVQHADGARCIAMVDGPDADGKFRIAATEGPHRVDGEARAVGVLDFCFEGMLRAAAHSSVCSVHSCGIQVPSGAVALLGVSGSGKTTLGVECAKAGLAHMGDEFGFLDLGSGNYWHAEYPVSFKKDAEVRFSVPGISGLPATSPFGIESTFYAREALGRAVPMSIAPASESCVLRAMIQVRRRAQAAPSLERLPVAAWIDSVMPSLDGPMPRNMLFSSLVALSAKRGIEVLRLTYDDARDGARLINDRFSKANDERNADGR